MLWIQLFNPLWIYLSVHQAYNSIPSYLPKKWCFQTIVLEKTLESPLNSKESKTVNPKGNQPWIFIGGTEAKALILRPPDMKSQLIGKDPDSGKDWRQEEKGATEDEMVGWHHWLNRLEFEQTQGDSEGQESLLKIMGLQEVRHDWVTEQHSLKLICYSSVFCSHCFLK